ncbi:MAG: dihydroneopterin aldolase [Chitinophagaceae bacterium]
MPATLTIKLNNLRFFAYHGLYGEELKIGNEFEVNVTATILTEKSVINDIEETVNYSVVYEIIKLRMKQPTRLLETLAMEIADAIHNSFPQLTKIDLAIKKLLPPIEQFIGNVEVTFCKEF